MARPDTEHVWPILDAAFREYGLPLRLRSDNGPPFATIGAGGLSRLAVKVIKAGVTPERIRPGKPQENGRHERLHLTLLQDTASPPAATLRAQQKRFARRSRPTYNEERPHAALGDATPAERYAPSPRRWDGVLRAPETVADETRAVKSNGLISWRGRLVYVSEALGGEPVGLAETDGRPLDGALRPDPARLHRASRRPAEAADAKGLMDLWTTLRVAHRVHSRHSHSRREHRENCVTHVVGQNCHPCPRLHNRFVDGQIGEVNAETAHEKPDAEAINRRQYDTSTTSLALAAERALLQRISRGGTDASLNRKAPHEGG